MLVDDRQTETSSELRRSLLDRLAGDFDRSRVGSDRAGRDLHQRGFSCAVLSEEGMDLTPGSREGDVLDRSDTAEPLPYLFKAKQRGLRFDVHITSLCPGRVVGVCAGLPRPNQCRSRLCLLQPLEDAVGRNLLLEE